MAERDMQGRTFVCSVDDLDKDQLVTSVNGVELAVFHHGGEYYVLHNTCPHQGGPLGDGKVEDGCVYCPWHGWQFDLESGNHEHGKAVATTYSVTVEDGEIYVADADI